MPKKAAPKKKAASKQSRKAVTPDTETEGRESLQFKQKLSNSVATTTVYDAGANTGDDGGGVSEALSSGASAISMAQTHPK